MRTKNNSETQANLPEASTSSLYAGPMTEAATEEKVTNIVNTATSSIEEVAKIIYAGNSEDTTLKKVDVRETKPEFSTPVAGRVLNSVIIYAGNSEASLKKVDAGETKPEFSTPVAGRALNSGSSATTEYQLKMRLEKLEQLRVKETCKMTDLLADARLELVKLRQEKDAQKKEFEKILRSRDVEIEILSRHLKSTTTKMTLMSQKHDGERKQMLDEIKDHKENNNKLVDKLASLQKELDEKSRQNERLQVEYLQYKEIGETKTAELVNHQENTRNVISKEVTKAKKIETLKNETHLNEIELATSNFITYAERKINSYFFKTKRVDARKALEYTQSIKNLVREMQRGVQKE